MSTSPPDRGLQAVRTTLSWLRTALAATALAALLVNYVIRDGTLQAAAAMTASMVSAAIVLGAAARRRATLREEPTAMPVWTMTLTSLSMSACVVGTAAVLLAG